MKKRILAAVLCASAVAAVAASGASAAAPSTLSGEVLAGSVTSFDGCPVVSTETVSFGGVRHGGGALPGHVQRNRHVHDQERGGSGLLLRGKLFRDLRD